MPSVPFSLRLDPALKERLQAEAKSSDRSTSYLATKAIETFLNAREAKRQAIKAAISEADQGEFISQDAVHAWLGTWDGETMLPEPAPDIAAKK